MSGTVDVTASVPEDRGCLISARTKGWVYSDRGIIGGGNALGPPAEVNVRN